MLKRSDLAKQLDLVVKQEIKNYNDSLNFVLESLRDLKSNIDKVRDDSSAKNAYLHSEHKKLSNFLNEKNNEDQSRLSEINSFINDLRVCDYQTHISVENLFNSVFEKLDELSKLPDQFLIQSEKMKELEEKVNRYCRIHDDNIVDLNMRIRKDMLKMKEEILSIPSNFVEEKKEMENKLNSHVIDVEGVLREIRLTKKEMYIMEKKIENLYTLLNRKQGDK